MSDGGQLQPFQFEGLEVRFVGTLETPEWVGADIVNILYPLAVQNKNQSTYLSRIPTDWKGSRLIATPGGRQEMVTLFEPGLYSLIARSESPLAVPFQKWVYEEVLPAIRKTGSYSTPGNTSSRTEAELSELRMLSEIDDLRYGGIRTGLDLMYELGGVDERTQLAVKDMVRDIMLRERLKKPALPSGGRSEIPVSDRARDLGYRPTSNQLKQIGRVAAKLYRVAHDGVDPPKREQHVDGTTRMVYCYGEADIEILDDAIALVMEKPKPVTPPDPEEDESGDPPPF